MPVDAISLRSLMDLGLNPETLIRVVSIMDDQEKRLASAAATSDAHEKRKAWDRQRKAKQRDAAQQIPVESGGSGGSGGSDNSGGIPVECAETKQNLPSRESDITSLDSKISYQKDPLKGVQKGKVQTDDKLISRRQAEADFEQRFWPVVPRRVGKDAALRAFVKRIMAGEATADELCSSMTRFAAAKSGADPEFIPHPATWLNQGRWKDDDRRLPPTPTASDEPRIDFGGGVKWPGSMVKIWVDRFRASPRSWPDILGPPPGQPGCRVPAELLREEIAA